MPTPVLGQQQQVGAVARIAAAMGEGQAEVAILRDAEAHAVGAGLRAGLGLGPGGGRSATKFSPWAISRTVERRTGPCSGPSRAGQAESRKATQRA